MLATIQLDVIGTNIPSSATFNLYSDNDGFTTVITSKTHSELINGTTATIPDPSTTIRLSPNSGCGNYIDITLDTGDLSPSFDKINDWQAPGFLRSIVGDGMSKMHTLAFSSVIHPTPNKNIIQTSTNNGDSFDFGVQIPSNAANDTYGENSFLLYNGENFFYICIDSLGSDTLNIYRVDSATSFTKIHSQTLPPSIQNMYGAWYINNNYYVSTNLGTYRSLSLFEDFTLVLNSISLRDIDNYGTHIYGVDSSSNVHKSTDNGLNWVSSNFSSDSLIKIFVESYDKHIILTNRVGGYYWYSTNGGVNYTLVYNSYTTFLQSDFFTKHNSIYPFKANAKLLYTTNPYTPTPTFTEISPLPTNNQSPEYQSYHLQRTNLSFYDASNLHTYEIIPT